ncbi:Aldehyde dehydrogenase 22A1 [Gracilariopsis chorda]|uniref:Aldehyde dehydrogenase 22A1 n=1 Tax=Gracilariopsis chorda TaxID=448386 RepID=A0A2V3IGK3_9FLOR|nr:Aldehyde dehydrogenase 22A1 [Gracilariopsis chorda]|eukprot:PXF41207.1 Aldehyde dehydrogenase 22A1 [Gracilariopsis chorda]
MLRLLRSLESRLAAAFTYLASFFATQPLSSQCAALAPSLPSINAFFDNMLSSPQIAIPFAFILTLSIAIIIPTILTAFSSDPILCEVPLPSKTFDPYDDQDADELHDDDVRPQLCEPLIPHCIECFAPATSQTLGFVQSHTPGDVTHMVQVARAAQPAWQSTSFKQRKVVLRVLRDYLLYNQKELCHLSELDTGKPPLDACIGEILPTLEKIRWLLSSGEAALQPDPRETGPITMHKTAHVYFMPLGVIAAIAPWNYPLHNFFNPVLAALYSGNAVVVKPSEYTIYSSIHFARIVRRALTLCGHSPDLVQLVVGGADVGEALVDASIDKLFFTGSTTVGYKVAKRAATRLLPVCLELGGKDAFVICDDADVSHAATICMRGVFQNAGQNCIGVERVFVHEKAMDKFLSIVLPIIESMRVGKDVGAMTMGEPAVKKIEDLIEDAVKTGAKLLLGGKGTQVSGKGSFFQPTVLKDVTRDMDIAKEEVFGPVMTIMTWSEDEQLVELINDCPFGLGSSVFSANTRRAHAIISGLRVGMSNVNDFATNYLCQSMPFGGTKQSGSDRFAGIEGLRGCCIMKSVTQDRFPGIRTAMPKAFKYPTGENAFELAAEINDLTYARGVLSKVDNVRNLIGLLLFPSWRPRTVGSG